MSQRTEDTQEDEGEGTWVERWLGDLPTLALAIAAALLIRTFVLQSFYVPSDSMFSTMLVGDHVFVNKLVYGVKLPFTDKRLPAFRLPRRGEVIVFQLGRGPSGREIQPADLRTDYQRDAFVKRLIGLPGDRVAVREGRIWLNGKAIPLEKTEESFVDAGGTEFDVWVETLGECKHYVLDNPRRGPLEMAERTIKPGRYFFMGDNRDNSHDGRMFGTVRREELEGPAGLLYWSWDWTGSWLALLNPMTWVENLVSHTRWSRFGRFQECVGIDEELPPSPSSSAG